MGDAAFLIDEPVAAGGLGTGPNPYDLLSAALGACTTMTIRLYAGPQGLAAGPRARRGQPYPRQPAMRAMCSRWISRWKASWTRPNGRG